jgi:hypothetical protein
MEKHDMTYGNARLPILSATLLSATLLLPVVAGAQSIEGNFRHSDINGDGAIDWSEHQATLAQTFQSIDSDRNGRFGPGEHFDWLIRTATARKEVPNGGSRQGARFIAKLAVESWDRDRNGTVSQAEYEANAEAAFNRNDTNHDKRMTLAEMKAGASPSVPVRQ